MYAGMRESTVHKYHSSTSTRGEGLHGVEQYRTRVSSSDVPDGAPGQSPGAALWPAAHIPARELEASALAYTLHICRSSTSSIPGILYSLGPGLETIHTRPANMAQANLLTPPARIPPQTALHLAQKAPLILSSAPTSSLPWPLSLLFSRETPETWTIHENLLLAALRTGDDASARQILDRLTTRFGADNERMIALKGIYEEALAKDDGELEKIFNDYEKVLKENPNNFSVRKRRVAVLKSLGRTADAITALTVLVENSPTDAEAWAELSELYASTGAWGQAIFCLEEVLLIMPNAWSVCSPSP